MKFFVDLLELGVGDVGVDLCGCDGFVAKHGLYAANVCAVAQQVGGVGVPKNVWGNAFGDTSFQRTFFYNTLNGPWC